MNITFKRIIYTLFLISIIPNNCVTYAGESPGQEFADFLFNNGQYYRAITEYYRLIYVTTDSVEKINMYRNIGLCYFHGADYEGYIAFLKENEMHFRVNSLIRIEMNLYLCKCYYQLKNYQLAISTLKWNDVNRGNPFYDETQVLSGLCYARIFDWQTAIKKMQLTGQEYPGKTGIENFSQALENFPKLPQRNRLLAGTLSSIVPGAGYMYCNRKGTGITSFIVNGLLIWTTRDALVQKQYGLAAAACFFGLGWYIGNIRGSVDAADVYNSNKRQAFIDYLLKKEGMDEYLISD